MIRAVLSRMASRQSRLAPLRARTGNASPNPRKGRGEEGAVAVEFAMTLWALLFLILGAIQAGLVFWNWNSMLLAVEEAGRYAMLYNPTNFPGGPPRHLPRRPRPWQMRRRLGQPELGRPIQHHRQERHRCQ
jgi:hypothetical protein